uniref:Uncharacterized protein n=1 Tax=Arundo donax TaxID=35708 RepID=A0A0A8YZ22_ARUDO
MISCAILAST